MKFTLSFVFVLLFSSPIFADDFRSIFDSKTLDGWKAPNMSYWSIEDGAITAESTGENPCNYKGHTDETASAGIGPGRMWTT